MNLSDILIFNKMIYTSMSFELNIHKDKVFDDSTANNCNNIFIIQKRVMSVVLL